MAGTPCLTDLPRANENRRDILSGKPRRNADKEKQTRKAAEAENPA